MNTIKILENLKGVYKIVYDPESKKVNFVGVHTLRWNEERRPSVGCTELDEEEIEAIDVKIKIEKLEEVYETNQSR